MIEGTKWKIQKKCNSIYDLLAFMFTFLSGKERRRRMVVVGRDGVEVRRTDKIRRAVGLEGQSII